MGNVMSIRPVSYAGILSAPGAASLMAGYAAECSIPEIGAVNPQPLVYEAMENAGVLQCFSVDDESGMVGFASLILTVLPHYGRKVATVESIYIEPEYRPIYGAELLRTLENHARREGCVVILFSACTESRLAQLLKLKSGYRHTNEVFCRTL